MSVRFRPPAPPSWCSSAVERHSCKLDAGGSIPSTSSKTMHLIVSTPSITTACASRAGSGVCASSSAAERTLDKRRVVGSTPTSRTMLFTGSTDLFTAGTTPHAAVAETGTSARLKSGRGRLETGSRHHPLNRTATLSRVAADSRICSSVVERRVVNPLVVGSIPTGSSDLWRTSCVRVRGVVRDGAGLQNLPDKFDSCTPCLFLQRPQQQRA